MACLLRGLRLLGAHHQAQHLLLRGASVGGHWRLVRGAAQRLLVGGRRLRRVALFGGRPVLLVEIVHHVQLFLGWQLLSCTVFAREAVVDDKGWLVNVEMMPRRELLLLLRGDVGIRRGSALGWNRADGALRGRFLPRDYSLL